MMTLQNAAVQEETIGVLKYIKDQKQSEDILAQFIGNVFIRDDIKDNMSEVLIDAVG